GIHSGIRHSVSRWISARFLVDRGRRYVSAFPYVVAAPAVAGNSDRLVVVPATHPVAFKTRGCRRYAHLRHQLLDDGAVSLARCGAHRREDATQSPRRQFPVARAGKVRTGDLLPAEFIF